MEKENSEKYIYPTMVSRRQDKADVTGLGRGDPGGKVRRLK